MSMTYQTPLGVRGTKTNDPAEIKPTLGRAAELKDSPAATEDPTGNYSIVAHCHLLWDWVWQRPQQFLSRLSQRHPVLYVETHAPSPTLEEPTATLREIPETQVTVLKIQFPLSCWHNGHFVDRERRRLVQETLTGPLQGRFRYPVQWFYDPMAVTSFAGHLDERANVYDCMDELSKFKHAPPDLVERERLLLSVADVVFTGGRKLWEAKQQQNPNCHFYGCGVDVKHFERAKKSTLPLPEDIRNLDGPVLGYFGVVDERLDYELIDELARAHPEWNIVMVGPTTKVDAAALPQRANLHWLGGRPYAELPAYAQAFDVCLMPFALNEATEYINPTKALEYMATARPIVSTAVADVVSNFSDVVYVAGSRHEFIGRCEQAIQQPDAKRVQRGEEMARDNTWESVVSHLERHVGEALERKRGRTFVHATQLNLSPRGGTVELPLPIVG